MERLESDVVRPRQARTILSRCPLTMWRSGETEPFLAENTIRFIGILFVIVPLNRCVFAQRIHAQATTERIFQRIEGCSCGSTPGVRPR